MGSQETAIVIAICGFTVALLTLIVVIFLYLHERYGVSAEIHTQIQRSPSTDSEILKTENDNFMVDDPGTAPRRANRVRYSFGHQGGLITQIITPEKRIYSFRKSESNAPEVV